MRPFLVFIQNKNEYSVREITEELIHIFSLTPAALVDELLEAIKGCSPAFFERLVVQLLVKMGYGGFSDGESQVVGKSGDGGIDGIIKQDPLGLDNVYIQAKRWEGSVGSPEIQKFVGAIAGKKASKGVFITASDFTSAAKEYAKKRDLQLF